MRRPLIAAALFAATMSAGQAQEDDEERQFVIAQFKGWTGIVLHCLPNTANTVVRDAICQSTAAEFNYLAENSGIPHRVSDGEDMFRMTVNSRSLGTPLILELDTSATSSRNGPIGVHVRLAAEKFYSTAIEQDAKPGDPEASPRGGDLVFWERTTIGAGVGDQQVARDMAPYVNDSIKVFFSQFLKGWRSK
ncbi:hypothetical protein E0H39_29740 [Rhizobium leguminosarum bv. viciae]|uniref:hypothetical protein n=1 Tax=Rhizobium leguminosarum TaxID=384 RepID=UPI00103AEE5A|nr:hypothetical protein [Rhizobium leguminosarum]TBY57690.1 hypothetical protein E0H39_29740 [Rhizobium leguminosarum bv. viciae]